MVSGCVAALALFCSGCSLILDFSGSTEKPIDAPFSDAECAFKEPNNTRDTALVLEVTDVGPAAICPTMGNDDRDFYRVTIPASSSVTFRINYLYFAGGDLDLQLTDTQGAQVSSSRSFDNDETIVCPGASPPCGALAAGDYFLEVFPGQPGMGNRYDISIVVTP